MGLKILSYFTSRFWNMVLEKVRSKINKETFVKILKMLMPIYYLDKKYEEEIGNISSLIN